ncbi:hypothetical protein [Pedobacter frigiditerrae]|uniref:hypothetical protein n=1 Tax=Pedobacter frigiditerrae TaxID=2530452 RepID=UPI0013F1430D|nr:hypothetical protein [Pedobacter frigiditerrae]
MTTDIKSATKNNQPLKNSSLAIRENVSLKNEVAHANKKPRVIRDIKINYPSNGLYGLL